MKIQIGNEPYIERFTGKPVEGRLTVCVVNTDVPARTYTHEGNNGFVECVNPMLLHGGMPDDSVFVDVGLYGLKIEKYIGPEGQMSAESPDEYFEQIDYLEAGMDFDPQASSANVVGTIEDLQAADPALGSVTVLWHTTEGDCTPRTYVWDAGSRDNIDGGYVVGSDVSDEGNWILVWGDEMLPCTFYGVLPGREENLNLLLNYPATVGSFRMATAPCVRFVAGDYTSDAYYATDKELVFDGGARFTGDSFFQCPRARVLGTRTSYVCDLGFTAPDAEAHSSWYRSLNEFWYSGAKYLYCDSVNYFTSTLIGGTMSLADKIIFGNSRLPTTYANGACYRVEANTVITGRIFNASDFVRISSDGFGDEIFSRTGSWDPGLISQGHHVQYDSLPDLDLFENADRWVKTMVERRARLSSQVWSDFTLDLQNRRLDNINPGTFTEIRNGTFNRLTISGSSTTDITLRNVTAADFTLGCRYLTLYDCDVSFPGIPSITAMWAYDSKVRSGYPWTDMGVQVIMERCSVGISFHRNGDNTTKDALLQFTDCDFQQNIGIYTKHLEMYRCKTNNNAIKVYPYKDGSNVYHLDIVLEGNLLNSAYPVEFTKIDTIGGYTQEDVYDCVLGWNITGNVFSGNAEGLRMRYWQNRTGSYWTRTFVKAGTGVHSIVYKGNVGSCPAEDMRGTTIADNKAYTEETVTGDGKVYKYAGAWKRCIMEPGSLWWNNQLLNGPNTLVKWYSWVNSPYDSLTYSLFTQSAWFVYPRAHDDPINNGDFFALAILIFGDYLRIVQRGDGDHNQGVIGKVI